MKADFFEPLTFGFSESELDLMELAKEFVEPDEFNELLDAAANAMPIECKPYVCSDEEIDQMVADELEFEMRGES